MAVRECVRCNATNASNGNQCSRTTCKYPALCWQHSKTQAGLKIAPSRIPGAGQGLFATREFKKGQTICLYGDVNTTSEEYEENQSGYGVQYSRDEVADAASTQAGIGRYADDCKVANRPHACAGNNARFAINRRARRVTLKATKKIKVGDEIYVPYGRQYWRRHEEE